MIVEHGTRKGNSACYVYCWQHEGQDAQDEEAPLFINTPWPPLTAFTAPRPTNTTNLYHFYKDEPSLNCIPLFYPNVDWEVETVATSSLIGRLVTFNAIGGIL